MNKVRTASEQSEHVYNQGLTEGYVNYVFTHQHGARGWHGVNVVNEVMNQANEVDEVKTTRTRWNLAD